jgi:hypothetical protein
MKPDLVWVEEGVPGNWAAAGPPASARRLQGGENRILSPDAQLRARARFFKRRRRPTAP